MISMRGLALSFLVLVTSLVLPPAPAPAGAGGNIVGRAVVAASAMAAGVEHTCALLSTGDVRCWGHNAHGELGRGDIETTGDDEPAAAGDYVRLGGDAVAIAAGGAHTCALLTTGDVRCWGYNLDGELGYGNTTTIGDDETPASAGDVTLGGSAVAITAGEQHTCALLTTGGVRCWGYGGDGVLGYGNTATIGDDETPASAGDVPLGAKAVALAAGGAHTCALLSTGDVRCWGYNVDGQLGYGNTASIGDDEPASAAGDVPVGGNAVAIATGVTHTCALLSTGRLRCWGYGVYGALGYGNSTTIGDDEIPASAGDVPLGASAVAITAGDDHTCAVLTTGGLRCWGAASFGQLGYGNINRIGDDEAPSAAGDVPLGDTVIAASAGALSTCATTASGVLRCWGRNHRGQLGLGTTSNLGDDEPAAAGGPVPLAGRVRVRASSMLTVRPQPRRDRRAPYRWSIRGHLAAAYPAQPGVCSGRVTVRISYGSERLARRFTPVGAGCEFRTRITIRDGALRRALPRPLWASHRTVSLRVNVSWPGNSNLRPSSRQLRAYAR